jgi:hypothetical protein
VTEPGWTAPEGWGPPTSPVPPQGPPQPGYGQPGYAQPGYGQPAGPGFGAPPPGYRPDVKPGVVPLRPLGLGELLDGSVGVLRGYPRPTLGMSAAVAVVATLLNVVLLLTAFRPFVDVDQTASLQSGNAEALESALGGAAVGAALTFVLVLLSGAILTGILTAVVGKAVLGQPLTLGEAWQQVRPALLKLLVIAFALAAVIGTLLAVGVVGAVLLVALAGPVFIVLAIPLMLAAIAVGCYLYVRLSLAPCVVVLERVSIGTALRRSWLLVKGDWWRVFGISLLAFVVAVVVGLVIQVPFELLGYGSVSDLTSGTDALSARTLVASSIGSIIAATLVDPFTAGVRALLYVDRRMRAEGLDVALAAAANERPVP